MKFGDKVLTPDGSGTLLDLHRFNKGWDHFGDDHSYLMYAVRLDESKTVLYYFPIDLKIFVQTEGEKSDVF